MPRWWVTARRPTNSPAIARANDPAPTAATVVSARFIACWTRAGGAGGAGHHDQVDRRVQRAGGPRERFRWCH